MSDQETNTEAAIIRNVHMGQSYSRPWTSGKMMSSAASETMSMPGMSRRGLLPDRPLGR